MIHVLERARRTMAALAVLALVASGAHAHGANLRAGDCAANSGLNSLSLGCGVATPPFDIVASVELSSAIPKFCAAGVIVDFQASTAALPNWWRFDATGCRSGSCSAIWNTTSGNACTSLWTPAIQSGIQVLPIEQWRLGLGGVNRIRYDGLAAIAGVTDLQQNDPINGIGEWGIVRLHITFDRTAGGAACTGCSTAVCAVLSEVDLNYGENGDKKATVTTAGTGGNSVMFNPAVPGQGCADGRATRNASWGSIKSLYR